VVTAFHDQICEPPLPCFASAVCRHTRTRTFMYIYLYMYIYIYICVYIYIFVYIYICVWTWVYVWVCTRMRPRGTRPQRCIRAPLYICVYIYIFVCKYICVWTGVYVWVCNEAQGDTATALHSSTPYSLLLLPCLFTWTHIHTDTCICVDMGVYGGM